YWDRPKVEAAADEYAENLDQICVFAVNFNEQGELVSGFNSLPNTIQKIKTLGEGQSAQLLLTSVNDVVLPKKSKIKDPDIVHEMLSDPEKRSRHIESLLKFSEGLSGIDIDY